MISSNLSSEFFFEKAVRDVIEIQEAKTLISELGISSKGFKNGRGLI